MLFYRTLTMHRRPQWLQLKHGERFCQCGFVYDSENEHVSDVHWLLGSGGCLHRNIIAIIEAIKTY